MSFRFLACLVLGLALFGCGADPAATVAGEPAAVSFKHNDNVLRVGMRQQPVTLNPVQTPQATARYVRELIFQTLTSMDPETYEQVPQVASVADKRREANGAYSYSYVIDPEARWPNGLPITAADVIFSLKALMNPLVNSGPYRPYYTNVESIVTSPNNERRFRVMTRQPYVLAEQAIGSLTVLPEYHYDPDKLLRNVRLGDLTDARRAERLAETDANLQAFAEAFNQPETGTDPAQLIGSGPYRLTEWVSGERLTLERRDDYWAADARSEWLRAEPERIEFTFIPDPQTMATALRDEALDVATDLTAGKFRELRDDPYLTARYDFATVPGMNYFGILLNQQGGIFGDLTTRRAIARLVDVDAIIEQLFPGGLARRVTGPVLADKEYYTDLGAVPYAPDEAAALLAEAGWADTNGDGTLDKEFDGARREFVVDFMVFPSPESEAIGALVAEWMREVGVTVNVAVTPPRQLYGNLDKGDFTMSLFGLSMDPNPDEFTQVWASTSVPPNGSNRSGFANAEADRLIRQIARTVDEEERLPLYQRFQEIIHEEQPLVFLLSPATRLVLSKRFRYGTTPLAPGVRFGAFTLRK